MQWVKLHVSLLDNVAYKRLSPDARLTLLTAIPLAGKQDQGGALDIRGVGPMTVAEIASYTGLPIKRQQEALDQLLATGGFLVQDLTGAYVVERFTEKCGDSSTERVQRFRKRSSNVTETQPKRECNALDKEEEKDIPNAIAFGQEWVKKWSDGACLAADPDSWLDVLGVAFAGFAGKELRLLSLAERQEFARIFAVLFANHRSSESKNRAKGVAMAAAIGRLVNSKHGDMTVTQYLRYGLKVLRIRGGKPFHNPFDIEACVEYETA